MPFISGSFVRTPSFLIQRCWILVMSIELLLVGSSSIHAQLPAGFIRERLASGLNPTSMVIAPDGRIFITEKNGLIRILRDDILLEDPFLEIEVDDANERGLGHMVLHPDFETNGYLYVFYAVPGLKHNRISRFTAIGDKVIPGSEKIIMELDVMSADIHNGGDMVFGFDGYLYVATGDGGQNWKGEDLGSTNGKVLRMDDEGNAVPDNPWYTFNYLRAKYVYAYGFRNPFTITQHPLTGAIYANDVGYSKFEEINHVERGAFYGWPRLEGPRINEEVPAEYQDPLFAYAHTEFYCCIVGSAIYQPSFNQFPEQYVGKYFYSDYCSGHMRVLNLDSGQDEGLFITDGDRVIDIDVSAQGSLYYLERKGIGDGSQEDNTSTQDGTLWKITYTGSGSPFISLQPESKLLAEGEDITFHVTASGLMPLLYTWYVDNEVVLEGDQSSYHIAGVTVSQDSTSVHVRVSNGLGQVESDTVLLRVTSNHRPIAQIQTPAEEGTYSAGTILQFSGLGLDEEDGLLPDSAMSWRIDFHHGTHAHPAMSWVSGISNGTYSIGSTGETSDNVWFRIYLKVTDSQGLSNISHRDVHPQLGKINVHTQPEGLGIHLDGSLTKAPFQVQGVRGISRFLSPPRKQVKGDSIYFFRQWTDGSHDLNREVKAAEQDQVFTAVFDGDLKGIGYGLTATYYDNLDFEGTPVGTRVDSVIDHNYFSGAPFPGMPEDFFSVQWDGYIQPIRSGPYVITVFSDDGVELEVDGLTLIQDWEVGFHNLSDTLYLESGMLYPIRLKLQEHEFSSQIRLRWSTPDFDEEIVPSAQLYPADYLSTPTASGIIAVESISPENLRIYTESYKASTMEFSIYDVGGHVWSFSKEELPAAKNILNIKTDFLPPGSYYFKGVDSVSQETFMIHFVKVK